MTKVLVTRRVGLGDVMMVTPIIRTLAKQYGPVHVSTDVRYSSLLSHNPYVQHVHLPGIDRNIFDKVYDLEESYNINDSESDKCRVLHWADLIGLTIDSVKLDYFVTEEEKRWASQELRDVRKPYVGFVWSASTPFRTWTQSQVLLILKRLVELGYQPILFGEHNQGNIDGTFNACGKYRLRATAALMNVCDMVISPDTGLFHLAAALDKQVALYSGSFGIEKIRTHDKVRLINDISNFPCCPCYTHSCNITPGVSPPPCLSTRTQDVITAVCEMAGKAKKPIKPKKDAPKPLFLTYSSMSPYSDMVELTRSRHEYYCHLHGYTYEAATLPVEHDLGWRKLQMIRDRMDDPRWSHIFYLDADAMIADLSYDLKNVLPDNAWFGLTIHPFGSSFCTFHYQMGVTYWRCCDEARAFLDHVLSLRRTMQDPINWQEQQGINITLLNDRKWQNGVVVLPHIFNVNMHNQNSKGVIVAAWHGADDRLRLMREWMENNPHEEHRLPDMLI